MEYSEDLVDNITSLYKMSIGINYSEPLIKNIPIIKSDGITLTGEFFRKISNNDQKVFSALKRYIYSMKEVPWTEGGMYINENNEVRILTPTLKNAFSTSILVHECTHALNNENIIKLDCEESHSEVLPLLNQFLFIDGLKDYYDINELRKSYMDYVIKSILLFNTNKYVECADKEIIDYEGIEYHFKYVLGSLYSIVLYEWFKNDKEFMDNYSKIYTGNGTLKSLLDYYEVNLEDKSNVEFVKSLMKK